MAKGKTKGKGGTENLRGVQQQSVEDQIRSRGRLFALIASPWIERDIIKYTSRPRVDPDGPEQFSLPDGVRLARAAAMYDILPAELQSYVKRDNKMFGDKVSLHMRRCWAFY